ncbi:MAG: AbrB/MazE/SpoVT family DNA-binding domain-containing protein [bacterium]|nr:AbrB/MazE/SpoVT family DNA-binding domain-containing protein [bacterium]
MRVTIKGQVTIPQHIRDKLGIRPATEIDFVEENDRVYIIKKKLPNEKFAGLRGIADVRTTTDEVMALTRGE